MPKTSRHPSYRSWHPLGEGLAAALAYAATTLLFLRPVWRLWRDHLAPDLGDPLFNTWVLAWTGRQWRLGFPDLWDANVFHPVDGALALSDHLLGPAALALPVAELTGSPIAAYNLLFLLAFVLCGLTTYAVLRASGLGPLAAFFGGAVFAFAPYRWGQGSHLQMLLCPLVPLVLWTFDRLLARPRVGAAAGFLAVYLLHLSGGIYLAYMIHLPLAVLLLNRGVGAPGWRSLRRRRALAVLLPTALVALASAGAVFLPYARVAHRMDLARGAENYRLFGANLPALLTPAPLNRAFPLAERWLPPLSRGLPGDHWFAEKTLFPGLLVLAAALWGGGVLWRRYRRPRPAAPARGRRAVLLAAGLAAVASYLTADLYTLGWWPAGLPATLQRPGAVYSLLGLTLVAAGGVWIWLRRRWGLGLPLDLAAVPPWPRGLALAGAASFLASFPVVFEPLADLVPGLGGMRVPARFQVFALLALAALAGYGVHHLCARLPRPALRRAAGAVLVLLLLVELAPRRLDWQPMPTPADFPPVYAWLDRHDAEVDAVLELPFVDHLYQVRYMYFSTRHWQPLANGFSGHFPRPYVELREICCWPVPEAEALALLREMGVSHLVVHPVWPKQWAHETYRTWLDAVGRGEVPGVRQVYADATGTRVFSL